MRAELAAAALLCACSLLGGAVSRGDCEWESFQNLAYSQMQETFRICPPDTQVDLYVRWSRATIPPNTDLADTMASLGHRVIPEMLVRIEQSAKSSDQVAKWDLLFVLLRMQDGGHYAVANDEQLMSRLERAVAAMTEPELKKAAERTLGQIKGQQS